MVLSMKTPMNNETDRVTPDVTYVTERYGELTQGETTTLLLRRVAVAEERVAELSDLVNILIGRIAALEHTK